MTDSSASSDSFNQGSHYGKRLTVSELTLNIKRLIEDQFSFVWICGEISNFSRPASGHFYFTLKDDRARISGVMFKGQNRNLKFIPENGMSISGMGRVNVYEPRGAYQVIFEHLEPDGVGSLQKSFEQLKERLFAEGLFDETHKKPLPFLPKKISVVTSPSGAVIHDMLKIIDRRFPDVHIEIVPVRVQGAEAALEIASAIKRVNDRDDSDIIVIARGGGSLEDIFAFNSEEVARAIYESAIPLVSAVGHETDFTIADMAADLRAPTPSAAAEMILPLKDDLKKKCDATALALKSTFLRQIDFQRRRLNERTRMLIDPERRIQDLRLKTDDLTHRLTRQIFTLMDQTRERLVWRRKMLRSNHPGNRIKKSQAEMEHLVSGLSNGFTASHNSRKSHLKELDARLSALNPSAILRRGYSIARTLPDGAIIKNAIQVEPGQEIEVILEKGSIISNVKRINKHGAKNI